MGIKLENFKSGQWIKQYQYKSFEPVLVNTEWTWEDPSIAVLLEKANKALGELDAFSFIVPDVDLFISMHVVKEAQTSSKIEGTQTGIEEALLPEEQVQPEKRNDWREVRNYTRAVNQAIKELELLPLSNRLLKQTHAILMEGVRGEHKQPGEFRTSQNWIGGSSIQDAAFIPPHPEKVNDLMGDLEKFWHNDAIAVPHLIRIAISHYQFETIHPFLDGNGRIGRLLVPLYLVCNGVLNKPSLYLSDFFERNRAHYYDALMAVRTSNNMIHWIKFFLSGVYETAQKGRNTFHKILHLRNDVEKSILTLGRRAPLAQNALKNLYKHPITSAGDLVSDLGISAPTANSLIKELCKLNILKEITGQLRGRMYTFDRYIDLFII